MSNRQKELLEMLLKQAGYKKEGFMYVNNALKSAFAVSDIFPKDDHLPLTREQADPSVLVEAFKKFISDYEWLLDKFSEQVSLDIPFVKECLSKKYVAKNALATYKESKPSPSISREQAEKVWEAAATYQQQAIYVNSYGGEIEALDKETYLKQFE